MKHPISLCIAAALLVLFLLLLPFLLFVLSLRGMISETVVMTVESPDGTYFAQVIDSNQGALGGATIVDVYKNQSFLGKHKKVDRVYIGQWGEYRDMILYWKSEHCLVINGIEYHIK